MPVTEIECRGCAKCCFLLVVLEDEDMARIKSAGKTHLVERHYGTFEDVASGVLVKDPCVLIRKVDGRCIALDPVTRCCKIYEHRPGICRDVEPHGETCEDILAGCYVCLFEEKMMLPIGGIIVHH